MSAILRASSADLGSSYPESVSIANAGTVSTAWKIGQWGTGGFVLPAAFTGTTVTFQVSVDGTTFSALNNSSGAVSLTVAQGKAYLFPADVFGFVQVKIVSGSAEGAARTIQVFGKG
ncbi:MAG: hypothetical protein ACREQ5_03435 [Candidatus Dormibacteria bacterium]